MADVLEALFPEFWPRQLRRQGLLGQEFGVHPNHQGLLVITAVEDANPPALRQALVRSPEVIVIEVQG